VPLPVDSREEAERIGRQLAVELMCFVASQHWGARQRLIVEASAASLQAHADGSTIDGARGDRATQIGRELAQQLVRAAAGAGWHADDERAAIAAAARRIRQARADAVANGNGLGLPYIGPDRAN
jgi:hypothetical protein